MKDFFHIIVAGAICALAAYFNVLLIPLVILLAVMLIDYITGMAGASYSGKLSFRVGIMGILKKAVVCGRNLEIREYYMDDNGENGFKSRFRRQDRGNGKDFSRRRSEDHGGRGRHGSDFSEERSRHDRKEEPRGKKGRVLRGVPFKFGA